MKKYVISLTGPSLAGKTTLTKKLLNEYHFTVLQHITTRKQRIDDTSGFYQFL